MFHGEKSFVHHQIPKRIFFQINLICVIRVIIRIMIRVIIVP